MPDRENVISHLQIMHTWAEFALEKDQNFFNEAHMKEIVEWTTDALELMKPAKPVIRKSTTGLDWYFCGGCNLPLAYGEPKYCHECGKPVLWEDEKKNALGGA